MSDMNDAMKRDSNMPVDLQLDLLIDSELPETDRKNLLLHMDREPGLWRDLSIRFLQRQVERETARGMSAGSLVSEHETRDAIVYRFPSGILRWTAVAAGLILIAATSTVTWYIANNTIAGNANNPVASAGNNELFVAAMPANVMGTDKSVEMKVPVVRSSNESTGGSLFMTSEAEDPASPPRRSLVIQPDGNGNAVIIPVNTLTNVSVR